MQNLAELVHHAARLRQAGKPFAVATLVKKEGSVYRQPGARLLVEYDGTARGMISGGCLEGELAEECLAALETGYTTLKTYDLTEDNILLGFHAGCKGIAYILVEPGDGGLSMLESCINERRPALMGHIFRTTRLPKLLGSRQLIESGNPPQSSQHWPKELSIDRFDTPGAHRCDVAGGTLDIFVEHIRPPIRLVVFGSGPDVRPLLIIARRLGWTTEVVGHRPVAELQARFPDADHHRFLMHPESAIDFVPVDSRSALVIMNHNRQRDATLVTAFTDTSAPYIGVLGPHERCQAMINTISSRNTTKIYGPVGLDIGAETSEEIALSIVTEIQMVFSGHSGGLLRDKAGEIHQALP